MRINYNVSSIIAKNALNNNDKRVAASTQKLSSGYKISSAADNAAGLAIARRMNAQIKSLQQANQNANDGLSAMNTVDGSMTEMHDILQRMNELAIQSANGTNSDSDREMIQREIDQLVQEIDRIANTTEFNAQKLLDGSFALKAFTNSENAKVMSYSEGVASGTYAIGQLTYYRYEDTVTRWDVKETPIKNSDGKVTDMKYEGSEGKITQNKYYEVDNTDEKLRDSLVTSSSISDYTTATKAFPVGANVSFEDDELVIRAENDFEIKVKVNDRTPLGTVTTTTVPGNSGIESIKREYDKDVTGSSVVTTTSFSSVTNYRNVAVQGDDGKRYVFKQLNFSRNVDSEGDPLGSDKIYTRFEDDDCRDLKDDLAGYFKTKHLDCSINIDEVEYDDTKNPAEFKVTYTPTDGKTNQTLPQETVSFSLYQDKNELGEPMTSKKLEDYKFSETFTKRVEYTIGKGTPDDCLQFDVTGMGAMIVHVGANSGQYMELEIPAMTAENLGIAELDLTTEDSATAAIDVIGDAINQLSAVRAKIGAYSNRLERTITNLDTTEENITSAYSRIMDVDMATEMTEYSTVQVLVQASNSMLAQANERPQQVLQLLQ